MVQISFFFFCKGFLWQISSKSQTKSEQQKSWNTSIRCRAGLKVLAHAPRHMVIYKSIFIERSHPPETLCVPVVLSFNGGTYCLFFWAHFFLWEVTHIKTLNFARRLLKIFSRGVRFFFTENFSRGDNTKFRHKKRNHVIHSFACRTPREKFQAK